MSFFRRGSGLSRRLLPGASAGLAACVAGRDLAPERLGRGLAACEVESPTEWPKYRPQYPGQLTPQRFTSRARTVGAAGGVHTHSGSFNSRWLRVLESASREEVLQALERAEDGATSAVYVGIPDDHLHAGPLVAELRRRGYRFWQNWDGRELDSDAVPGELMYYRWFGQGPDMVPSYHTALEGIGCLVLSPDKKDVLLVWEYGHWKMITGNVDAGEDIVRTVVREAHEEVGVEVEGADTMMMVGGWQMAKARDKRVNNIFFVFTAVAKSRELKVDNVEITEARWFPIDSLPGAADVARGKPVKGQLHSIEWDVGTPGRNNVSKAAAEFLDVHRNGRGLRVRQQDNGRQLFS